MKAIIFSAGLGTRLYPLTKDKPKALVELEGKPLLWHAIQKLKSININEIVINIHHFGEQIIEYIQSENFNIPIQISDERNMLLETGGGLLYAKNQLQCEEAFIACNVDIISTVDLKKVIDFHSKNNALATLVVRDRKTSRYLLFDEQMQLTGWKNISTEQYKIARSNYKTSSPLAFSGIQIISGKIFDLIEEKGKFSIVDLYLRLAKTETIIGYKDNSNFWLDLGKPGQIEEATRMLKSME